MNFSRLVCVCACAHACVRGWEGERDWLINEGPKEMFEKVLNSSVGAAKSKMNN